MLSEPINIFDVVIQALAFKWPTLYGIMVRGPICSQIVKLYIDALFNDIAHHNDLNVAYMKIWLSSCY